MPLTRKQRFFNVFRSQNRPKKKTLHTYNKRRVQDLLLLSEICLSELMMQMHIMMTGFNQLILLQLPIPAKVGRITGKTVGSQISGIIVSMKLTKVETTGKGLQNELRNISKTCLSPHSFSSKTRHGKINSFS